MACSEEIAEPSLAQPGIDLTPDTEILRVGELRQFRATLYNIPAGKPVGADFVSRNTQVATVSGTGEVQARSVGSAYIVAIAQYDPSLRDSSLVTVQQ